MLKYTVICTRAIVYPNVNADCGPFELFCVPVGLAKLRLMLNSTLAIFRFRTFSDLLS
jgi:hypothetical protein